MNVLNGQILNIITTFRLDGDSRGLRDDHWLIGSSRSGYLENFPEAKAI